LKSPFTDLLKDFFELMTKLQSKDVMKMHLGSLESLIEVDGREIQRLMLEEQIGLRGPGNVGESVEGSDNVLRSHKRIRSVGLSGGGSL
jgi:hypothetical protein